MGNKNLLPTKTGDLSDWYTSVIKLADLVDYGPAKGTMIIKPYGYAIWEKVQQAIDEQIKERGVDNCYFPIFIPMSLIEKEANHVEGFAPELAVVTHGGGEKLEEPLVVRPTSETIMYNSYAKWVQSWRDLPVVMNQWNNVVRWEKRTMPFLRTSEFLWQEGHTAHATHEEAIDMQKWAMTMYASIYRDYFAIDGYEGWKSTSERFAGADNTLTYESLMPSGKALQACTSHDLGQNFSKTFDISFQAKDSSIQNVWQTSWGFSTRSVGGLILSHGDDNGLVLPPKLAPLHVVIVTIKADPETIEYCRKVKADIETKYGREFKIFVDERDDETFGFKLNKWEVKGVPVVCKIGAREREEDSVTHKQRFDGVEKQQSRQDFVDGLKTQLEAIQASMLKKSSDLNLINTKEAKNYDEFKEILKEHKGFVKVFWNDNPEIEKKIKDETKATSRCRPIRFEGSGEGVDFYTGEPSKDIWLFAQSY